MSLFDGERLAELRRALHLTGLELARRAECSNVTISRIENGHQQPTSSLARRLAKALRVAVEDLYVDPLARGASLRIAAALGTDPSAFEADPVALDSQMEVVIGALRRMDPVRRAKAVGYILGLASSSSSFAAEAAARLAESAERARQEPPAPPAEAPQ